MKILVCGKAPCLPDELKDRTLNEFDIVVRVNNWLPIKNRCNRFDAWVFYPWHSPLMHEKSENSNYDFTPYLKQNPKLWLGHAWAKEECKKVSAKYPDHTFTLEEFNSIMTDAKTYSHTTGVFAIHLAMKLSDNVTIAGFDFYSGTRAYYQNDEPVINAHMHNPDFIFIRVEKQINKGLVKWI